MRSICFILEIPVCELSDLADFLIRFLIKILSNYNGLQTYIESSTDTILFDKERSMGTLLGISKRVLKPGEEHLSDKTIDSTKKLF